MPKSFRPAPTRIWITRTYALVDVVLLARAGLDDALVRRLTDGLFRMLPQLSAELPFLKGMAPERAPATPVPLHPGAALYYRERELRR